MHTSWALEDMGEQRSPKKLPERTAPPVRAGSRPAALDISMQITPMVLAVPNEVPVRKDIMEHRRNVHSTKNLGSINPMAWYRIKGMVPQVRQMDVREPISTKMIRIFLTFPMPSPSMEQVSLTEYPLERV